MALRNYAEEDEEDFYDQDFERDGFVSVWLGMNSDENDPDGLDVLQDLCGVGYYETDSNEGNCFGFQWVPVEKLLAEMSYANSFIAEALAACTERGIQKGRWVILQYNFAYNPEGVKRKIEADPIFIGSFPYKNDADKAPVDL